MSDRQCIAVFTHNDCSSFTEKCHEFQDVLIVNILKPKRDFVDTNIWVFFEKLNVINTDFSYDITKSKFFHYDSLDIVYERGECYLAMDIIGTSEFRDACEERDDFGDIGLRFRERVLCLWSP